MLIMSALQTCICIAHTYTCIQTNTLMSFIKVILRNQMADTRLAVKPP